MTRTRMSLRQNLLAMTAASAVLALPIAALAQQGGSSGGGSSMQSTTTQTTPQQGALSGSPAARSGAEPSAAAREGTAGSTGPARPGATTAQGNNNASGGVMAQGNTSSPRDGTPGNPPSTATQRAADSVTGNRTPPDGTPGNPPGTAAGRATDRALGTNTTGANPGGTTGTTTQGAATGMPSSTVGAGAGAGTMAVDSATLRSGRRASKVIGSNIYNENNESIGEVDDIIIPPGGGAPVAVISVGGFLGIGSKLVAVPYDRLQMNTERNRWTMSGASKDGLTQLPTFSYDNATTDRRG